MVVASLPLSSPSLSSSSSSSLLKFTRIIICDILGSVARYLDFTDTFRLWKVSSLIRRHLQQHFVHSSSLHVIVPESVVFAEILPRLALLIQLPTCLTFIRFKVDFFVWCNYVSFLEILNKVISGHSHSLRGIYLDASKKRAPTNDTVSFFYILAQKCPLLEELRLPYSLLSPSKEIGMSMLSCVKHCPSLSNLSIVIGRHEDYLTESLALRILSLGKALAITFFFFVCFLFFVCVFCCLYIY